MVDISERLRQIKNMVDEGQYFTINRARQYGKTTTLRALEEFLQKEYTVVSLDFQRMSYADTVKTTLQDFADGKMIPYNPLNPAIEMAEMFGFIKRKGLS